MFDSIQRQVKSPKFLDKINRNYIYGPCPGEDVSHGRPCETAYRAHLNEWDKKSLNEKDITAKGRRRKEKRSMRGKVKKTGDTRADPTDTLFLHCALSSKSFFSSVFGLACCSPKFLGAWHNVGEVGLFRRTDVLWSHFAICINF